MRGERNHFAEGSGMHACLVGIADFCCTQVGMRYDAVDERRLAHTAVATEQGNLAFQQGAQLLDTLSCCR